MHITWDGGGEPFRVKTHSILFSWLKFRLGNEKNLALTKLLVLHDFSADGLEVKMEIATALEYSDRRTEMMICKHQTQVSLSLLLISGAFASSSPKAWFRAHWMGGACTTTAPTGLYELKIEILGQIGLGIVLNETQQCLAASKEDSNCPVNWNRMPAQSYRLQNTD